MLYTGLPKFNLSGNMKLTRTSLRQYWNLHDSLGLTLIKTKKGLHWLLHLVWGLGPEDYFGFLNTSFLCHRKKPLHYFLPKSTSVTGNHIHVLPPPALEATGDSPSKDQDSLATPSASWLPPHTPCSRAQVFTGTAKCYWDINSILQWQHN